MRRQWTSSHTVVTEMVTDASPGSRPPPESRIIASLGIGPGPAAPSLSTMVTKRSSYPMRQEHHVRKSQRL